ncbi:DUF3696 domain-containing protein [Aurantimonas sp. A3-2-R12]|uniref:DUF3696 domain-containing protein n=1 Tax=Aurantimonas sp. A3-2-R12 TaxID=3114362 RepID=UPI002E170120|nr:DUF3696 domain-containing protein [Aurantimonas sp. A3-2-R12]
MINRVRYVNFKRYSDITLDLNKKITVLVGPNSSGKSSLLKGILAFKQTYEDPTDHTGFVSEGKYVDIGHFDEYVRNHDSDEKVTFVFEVEGFLRPVFRPSILRNINRAFISISHREDPQTRHGRVEEYSVYLSSDANDEIQDLKNLSLFIKYHRMQKSEEAFKIEMSDELLSAVEQSRNRPRSMSDGSSNQDIPSISAQRFNRGDLQAQRDNQRGMLTQIVRGGYDESVDAIQFLERLVIQPIHTKLAEDLNQRFFALAALREKPARSVKRTDERRTVGSAGENTASVYFSLRQRAIKAGARNSSVRENFAKLDGWFNALKLGKDIEINSWRDLIDMRTRTHDAAKRSDSVVDIGVGFSQASPVLVQLAAMPDDAMLIMEQPELHLYPWAQSKLGQIFCDEVQNTHKRIVLETHSEHIIGGIQLHISGNRKRGSGLKPSDIQILYVDTNSKIVKLEIDEYGEFTTEWPAGFFDQTIQTYRKILQNKID